MLVNVIGEGKDREFEVLDWDGDSDCTEIRRSPAVPATTPAQV
jgi:hypothetical protein